MKKTLIALMALASVAMGAETLTLFDQWTFDSNLTSTNGRTFTGQRVGTTFADGVLSLTLELNSSSGMHLNDENTLGLTEGNWAVQLTMQLEKPNSGGTAVTLACLNNASGGTQLAVANGSDGGVYGFAVAPGFSSWAAGTRTDSVPTTAMSTLTILNYDGVLYFGQNDSWAKFGGSNDGLTLGDNTLGKLTLGFGQGGANGMEAQTIKIDDISVYTFDSTTVGLAEVKSSLIPEPATATLSLLALAGLAARRRRK